MEYRVLFRAVFLLLRLLLLINHIESFNLDIHAPIFKVGPANSYFGFSVAGHFNKKGEPLLLVGAPRAESGQPGTVLAGAVFACDVSATYTNSGPKWCRQQLVEYVNPDDFNKNLTFDKLHFPSLVHPQGKDGQLLGTVVASSATSKGVPGKAVACAPLKRYHNISAYTDGECFVLNEDLKLIDSLFFCHTLPRNDRHNDYGLCMEGFSAYVESYKSKNNYIDDIVIAGLPGARKWTGGVATKIYPGDLFGSFRESRTMGVAEGGILSKLQAHDYLGYSVTRGRYGFWYEDAENSTVAAGATRLHQHGAVVFLPLILRGEFSNELRLTEDSFILNGTRLGSGFGYAIATTDLNGDGFDDLIVGAPFEYFGKATEGGAVYVYFSSGVRRSRGESAKVFLEPIRITGKGSYSQFGASISPLGNVDGDPDHLNDFAVGAPFADGGGGVFVFSGAKSRDEFKSDAEQEIYAKNLAHHFPGTGDLKTFGFSLSGSTDADENGYNDLLVGAFASDTVVLLRARPVINIKAWHVEKDLKIDINNMSCSEKAATCFNLTMSILVDPNFTNIKLLDFATDVFTCMLQIIPLEKGISTRGKILLSDSEEYSWNCGRNANFKVQQHMVTIYVPKSNRDFINPLKFRCSVKFRDASTPVFPKNGGQIVNLNKYPVLNKFGSEHVFTIQFNKECGTDDICLCDLVLKPALTGIAQEKDGTYVTQVNETAAIKIAFSVKNAGERAYEATLYVEYNSAELEIPIIKSKRDRVISIRATDDNLAVISLGNPVEPETTLVFELVFRLANGRTGGLGKPLEFRALVNSTSQEINMSDNEWSAVVRVIKKAELELTATTLPDSVRFGGPLKGASAMKYDEDIGPEVYHRYYVANHGPWAVNNITVEIDWPYQLASKYTQGKYALYLIELPRVTTTNVDDQDNGKRCSVLLPLAYINPLQVIISRSYSVEDEIRSQSRSKRDTLLTSNFVPAASRNRNIKMEEKDGERFAIVNCAEKTAKCFTIKCSVDFLSEHATATIELRARLWNATFVEDYYDIAYIVISSHGRIILDPMQGIEETDKSNNFAIAATFAYPDRPAIQETKPVPWWLYAAAILGGILILLCLILILWRCGFFKRHRPNQPELYQAEFQYRGEEWTES